MNEETKLLLEHCLAYIKTNHSKDDGGVHLNLIARLKEALDKDYLTMLTASEE